MKYFYLLFSLVFISTISATAQLNDSAVAPKDSVIQVASVKNNTTISFKQIVEENRFLNSKSQPVFLAESLKKRTDTDGFFYLLAGLALILGIAKTGWPRYFTNMFRVFFNSSLRQSQLTDQLVQDKLPSLIFNLFFVIVGGVFVYLLLQYFNATGNTIDWVLLAGCIAGFAVIYFVKFVALKITGWMTGYMQEADLYTFIVFLINKIVAICLLPIIIIMSFADKNISHVLLIISLIVIGVMLLMRFFRSYGLLQHRLKIGRFHFLLYIFSLEVLPLFLIYKAALLFFSIKS
ncbi:MAG: DUF4271 domain-containing protein [Ferruginibacter sp.]